MIRCNSHGIPVISFIGYSGSGKTLLLKKVIAHFKQQGYRVAVLKHDVHQFEMDHKDKDTWDFAAAGADVVAISSKSGFAYIEKRQSELPLSEVLDGIRNVDIIFIEGYKAEDLPKIEAHRQITGHPLCSDPDNLLALVSDEAFLTSTPIFQFEDIKKLCSYLEDYLRRILP